MWGAAVRTLSRRVQTEQAVKASAVGTALFVFQFEPIHNGTPNKQRSSSRKQDWCRDARQSKTLIAFGVNCSYEQAE